MRNIIFLDIDGVLNTPMTKSRSKHGYIFVDDKLCERLKVLVEKVNGYIVLTSTWRIIYDDFREISEELEKWNCKVMDKTEHFGDRGAEICKWLSVNWDREDNFIILDDEGHDIGCLKGRLVETCMNDGLTDEDVAKAVKMFEMDSTSDD